MESQDRSLLVNGPRVVRNIVQDVMLSIDACLGIQGLRMGFVENGCHPLRREASAMTTL